MGVLRRHNDPSRGDYIIEQKGTQHSAKGRYYLHTRQIIGLSVVISPREIPDTITLQRLKQNNVAVKGKYESLGGPSPRFWESYKNPNFSVPGYPITALEKKKGYVQPCAQVALFSAMIELEAPGFSNFTADNASPTVQQIENLFRPIRRAIHSEMQANDPLVKMIMSLDVMPIEQIGSMPGGILGVINNQQVKCHGFKAKVYITKDCLENHPIFRKCIEPYQAEVVDDLPTIQPYERAIEWTIKPNKSSARPVTLTSQSETPLQKSEGGLSKTVKVLIILAILVAVLAAILIPVFCCSCCEEERQDFAHINIENPPVYYGNRHPVRVA